MNSIALFIIVLVCILAADLLTGLFITLLYEPTTYVDLNQTYMFYVIAALLITICITIILKTKKRTSQ